MPDALRPYLPEKHSWSYYQMHSRGGNPDPITDTGSIELRADQRSDVDTLNSAFRQGAPEVLVASKTGTGKTFVALVAAMEQPSSTKILVVCPKSAIPAWRHSIEQVGAHGKKFCVINYESLGKLIQPPPSKAKTQRGKKGKRANMARANNGKPYVKWDVVIFDEAHYLQNPESQRTRLQDNIISSTPGIRVIKVSATIGRDPERLYAIKRGLGWSLSKAMPAKMTAERWADFCQRDLHLTMESTRGGMKWVPNKKDSENVNKLIFGHSPSWAVRTDPGWERAPRYRVPVQMTTAENRIYKAEWAAFQKLNKERKRLEKIGAPADMRQQASQKGFAAYIRYRQKAGILKAPYVAEMVKDLLEGDTQVAISAEYMSTIEELLKVLGRDQVALFTGQNTETREQERLSFQRGAKRIIIFTPPESFNLHQNDAMSGGNDVPRVQVCADLVPGIKGLQKEGRTTRNGMIAPIIYPYAEGTIDNKIVQRTMQSYETMDQMMGETVVSPESQIDKERVGTVSA